MKRKIVSFDHEAVRVPARLECGHTITMKPPGLFLLDDEAFCPICVLAADPRYVEVELSGKNGARWLLCACLCAEDGSIRGHQKHADGPATGYALKDCPDCGGDGVQG